MNKIKINIWGRVLELTISYACYPGEEITEQQQSTAESFCSGKDIQAALEGARALAEVYLIKHKLSDGEAPIANIFKYVMPKAVYIPRNKRRTAALIFNLKYDLENNMVIIFEKGKLKEIGTQDIL